ncbi:transposase [Prosthecochloris ethylica]|uniref:transposase n=1 Tax=Prosthecochloris ethylica TaxID=2743976 RepID=UPI001F5B5257|nr:transposase [Prosthecochloris ethylica]
MQHIDAATHDSQELETLIDKDDAGQKLYADSAYIGQEESIEWCNMISMVQEKATAGKPLTKNQKSSNRKKSRVRSRGEHVFGFMTNTIHALSIHTIGMSRAAEKNRSLESDLQHDALCAAEKACTQCLSSGISASYLSISVHFTVKKMSKKSL